MVFAGRTIRIAGVRFTAQEAQFLAAGIRRGIGVRQMRTIFRESFDRGLPSTAFTETRRTLTSAELAGIRLRRGASARALPLGDIPRIDVIRPRSRFVMTGEVRAIVTQTGNVITRLIRFGTDETPTIDVFLRRAAEILDKGVSQAESAMRVDQIQSLSVVEQRAI